MSDQIYTRFSHEKIFVESDGVKLETHVFLPVDPEIRSWPVLLTRTPYPRQRARQEEAAEAFARAGIGFVFQFCRGTGESEGVFEPNVDEERDGLATVRWLNGQEWCSAIGLQGSSYMALTAWVIADKLPDKVVGMFVSHYGVDRHKSAYQAGLFRHDILTGWTLRNCGKDDVDDGNFYDLYMKAAGYRPHLEADERVWGVRLDWYRKWITEPDYDSAYWQTGFWKELHEKPAMTTVPVCIVAGWFDHHLEGTLLAYELLNEAIKPYSKLIVGSWNHSFVRTTGGYDGKEAAIDIHQEMYDWFYPLFFGRTKKQRSKVYVVGADRWVETEDFDAMASSEAVYYLTDDFRLSRQAQEEESRKEYDYDPENPVQSVGGETLFVSEHLRGSVLQPDVTDREDVLEFETGTLDQDLVITGRISIDLVVESDCEDTCFAVKVIDVFENGDAYNMRNQITTMAYRNQSPHRILYEPGTKTAIALITLPVAWKINKGHRLKLQITSSNLPEYAIHANYPGAWSLIPKVRKAAQKLYLGGDSKSRIRLPVMTEGEKK